MHLSTLLSTLLLASSSFSTPLPEPPTAELAARAPPTPYWLLAGDSTTTPGAGWGDGFLSTTLSYGAAGTNYAVGGASTASCRASGRWATILSQLAAKKAQYSVYVTIQFGHNDQKPTSGVSIEQYQANLERFAAEVKSAGGTPILVTPLTRRTFSGGKVVENLAEERKRTIAAAERAGAWYIDLNGASTAHVNAIGASAARAYNLAEGDYTHLNARGSVVFGRLVSDLLVAKYGGLKAYTKEDAALSKLIREGKPA